MLFAAVESVKIPDQTIIQRRKRGDAGGKEERTK